MSDPGASSRGPSGSAPLPPDWLGEIDLPLQTVAAETTFYRIHRLELGPVFFGPGQGRAPVYRFDSLSRRFGVLYLGFALAGALVETVLRNPARRMVPVAHVGERGVSILRCRRPLRLVTMHGAGLQAVGTDNAIATGPYDPCGAWSDALWDHPEKPDGLIYASRHDPAELCAALFERPGLAGAFGIGLAEPLLARPSELAQLLKRYRKSLDDPAR